MKANPTTVTRYERRTDPIFGTVERFQTVHEHRVQIKIGGDYFISTKTYKSLEGARRAALRLSSVEDRP
jgi:hypothetical protein